MQHSDIGPVARLTGEQAQQLINELSKYSEIISLDIAVNEDGARFQINHGIWSPPVGELVAHDMRAIAMNAVSAYPREIIENARYSKKEEE